MVPVTSSTPGYNNIFSAENYFIEMMKHNIFSLAKLVHVQNQPSKETFNYFGIS